MARRARELPTCVMTPKKFVLPIDGIASENLKSDLGVHLSENRVVKRPSPWWTSQWTRRVLGGLEFRLKICALFYLSVVFFIL